MHWGVFDQSIQELEDKLFSQILLSQQQFNCVRPSDAQKVEASQVIANQLQQYRGCDFPLPSLFSGRGHGPFVELIDGAVKYDLVGGIGPYFLGHSHPLQIRAALASSRGSVLNSTNFIPAVIANDTSRALIDAAAPSKLKHCWFSGSGSMANDTALRLLSNKRPKQTRLIAFEKSFAGRSLSMQAITAGHTNTSTLEVDYLPFPSDDQSSQACLSLARKLLADNVDSYVAFHGELIQGEAGVNLPQAKTLKELFKLFKQAQVPIWIDEVQSFVRTTEVFAFQTFDLAEYVDICTIGKALNTSCVLYSSDFANPLGAGGTFQGSLASLIYAHDLLRLLKCGNMLGKSGRLSKLEHDIRSMFTQVIAANPLKACQLSCRGIGTLWAFHLGNGEEASLKRFMKDLYDNGIIAWRAGRGPYSLRLLFPVTMTKKHLEQIGSIFLSTLEQADYLE